MWVAAFQEASQVYTRIEEMGLNKVEKRRLQTKLKAKQQQAPNVVMDVIPLADIYKVRTVHRGISCTHTQAHAV